MSPEVTLAVLVTAVLCVYAISAHDTNFRSKRNALRRRHRPRMPMVNRPPQLRPTFIGPGGGLIIVVSLYLGVKRFGQFQSWLSQMDRSSTDGMSRIRDMSAFIPAVPSESEVDCQIEFEVVRAVGGRCVRLGGIGRTAVCQSGMYLDVQNAECENILRAREFQSSQEDQNHDLQHRQISDDSSDN